MGIFPVQTIICNLWDLGGSGSIVLPTHQLKTIHSICLWRWCINFRTLKWKLCYNFPKNRSKAQFHSQGPWAASWHTTCLCHLFFWKLCSSVINSYKERIRMANSVQPISKRSRDTLCWVSQSHWVWFQVACVGSDAKPSFCMPVSIGTLDLVENLCCCQVKESNCWLRDTLSFTGLRQSLAPSKCSIANAKEVGMSLLQNLWPSLTATYISQECSFFLTFLLHLHEMICS